MDGISVMRRNRHAQDMGDLARGPGRRTAALAIDRHLDGIDLRAMGSLRLARDDHATPEIGASSRIGLSRVNDRRLRFYVRGSRCVIGPNKLNR